MSMYLYVLFWVISFVASIVGAICGIGGGVIIKPVLDAFGVLSVPAISFLSGCTVLAMSSYSVVRGKLGGESLIDLSVGTPLAIGAAIGGIAGKGLLEAISSMDKNMLGAVQAGCLLLMTAGTLLYTIKKDKIRTLHITNVMMSGFIGLMLGIFSSFLGVGGGPINLVVLFYFFSMDTKPAAQNSLYIIFFSQITSLISSLVTGTVPEFSIWLLVLMVIGGILGAVSGRSINKKLESHMVDKLFIILMGVIIVVNIYNIYHFIR